MRHIVQRIIALLLLVLATESVARVCAPNDEETGVGAALLEHGHDEHGHRHTHDHAGASSTNDCNNDHGPIHICHFGHCGMLPLGPSLHAPLATPLVWIVADISDAAPPSVSLRRLLRPPA